MTINRVPAPAVARAIAQLGEDVSKARRRRRLSRASLAERSGVSEATLKRLEKGDGSVALENFARALNVLGELDRLENLLDSGTDELGLVLMDEQLPKRVRQRRSSGGTVSARLLRNARPCASDARPSTSAISRSYATAAAVFRLHLRPIVAHAPRAVRGLARPAAARRSFHASRTVG